MYCSFKCGEFEDERNGIFFLDSTEEKFREFVSKPKFQILEFFMTADIRRDTTEKWLNAVFRK